jgi:hypothetical protein
MKQKKIDKEIHNKITIEGEEQYKAALYGMKAATVELRKEIEQLNIALEKEAELLKKLS